MTIAGKSSLTFISKMGRRSAASCSLRISHGVAANIAKLPDLTNQAAVTDFFMSGRQS